MDRLGYLGYYREYWNCFLSADDHLHEPGEDVSECYNCILDGLADKLSQFEVACWTWYNETVSQFAMEAGVVGEMFKDLKLTITKALFLRAMSEIHFAFSVIQADKQRQKKAEA